MGSIPDNLDIGLNICLIPETCWLLVGSTKWTFKNKYCYILSINTPTFVYENIMPRNHSVCDALSPAVIAHQHLQGVGAIVQAYL